MDIEPRAAITPQLVIGLFILLFGLVLTLERLQVVQPGHLKLFWPLVLMALGTALLLRRQDSRGRFWGIFWTAIGAYLALNAVGVVRVGLGGLIVPVILILIGMTIVSRTLKGVGPPRPPRPHWPERAYGPSDPGDPTIPPAIPFGVPQSDSDGTVSLFTIMGEAKRASNDKPFRGGELTAFLGGCKLDLRQAEIAPGDRAVVNILAVMAGHEIWVPPGWTVASDIVPLLGGVEDKRLPPITQLAPDSPRLVLKGFVLMGGVVVKN
jgi:hypothetical protein